MLEAVGEGHKPLSSAVCVVSQDGKDDCESGCRLVAVLPGEQQCMMATELGWCWTHHLFASLAVSKS